MSVKTGFWRLVSRFIPATKSDIEKLMATQAEIVADLKAVLEQQKKTSGEIATVQASVTDLKAKIVELQAIIDAGGTITPELVEAVAAVKAQAQLVDDQIPDAPVA